MPNEGNRAAVKEENDPRNVRRAKALAMKVAGATYQQIGDELGVDVTTAWDIVTRQIRKASREMREDALTLRRIAHERYEAVIRKLWTKVFPADPREPLDHKAVWNLIRTIERDARIMGYAAPEKHQVDMNHLSSQLALVIEVVTRVIPDEHIPRVEEALREALDRAASRERSIDGPDTVIDVPA